VPAELKTCKQPIVSIPSTQGCNDVASGLSTFLRRSIARDRALAEDAPDCARVMTTLVHHMTAEQIFRRRPRDGTGKGFTIRRQ
jgi:hypothetical protein